MRAITQAKMRGVDPGRGGFSGSGSQLAVPAAKVGLWLFMGVVTTLFFLCVNAYVIRMGYADWRPLPELPQLRLNTAVLVLSSLALQWARVSARRGQVDNLKLGLLAGGALAFAFLAGQLWAWQQLNTLDYLVANNPANSFFYLITALHGLHLLGGLVAWGRTAAKVWRGAEMQRVRLSVDLCAAYWHFLLVVWLILFGLLFFMSPGLIQIICGSP